MDIVKKTLGIVWILAGIYAGYYLVNTLAVPKIMTGKPEDLIPAIIYIFLVPIISLSLIIFGVFSLGGEFKEENM